MIKRCSTTVIFLLLSTVLCVGNNSCEAKMDHRRRRCPFLPKPAILIPFNWETNQSSLIDFQKSHLSDRKTFCVIKRPQKFIKCNHFFF